MTESFQTVLLLVLVTLLLVAALGDVRRNIISNQLNAGIALLAIPYWFALRLDGSVHALLLLIGQQLALGVGVFLLGAILFYFNVMGGGDVKMMAALALWVPSPRLSTVLFVMSATGGVLAAVVLVKSRLRTVPGSTAAPPLVPYGVAIAAGGLAFACEPIVNAFMKW